MIKQKMLQIADKEANFLIDKIQDNQKQINNILKSQTAWEEKLAKRLMEILKKDPDYPKVKKTMDIQLCIHNNTKAGTMLECICAQVSQSAKYPEQKMTKEGAIDFGIKYYYIPKNDPENSKSDQEIKDYLKVLNDFLIKHNVLVSFTDIVTKRFIIKIFPLR